MSLNFTDKHGTKIYRDLSALENPARFHLEGYIPANIEIDDYAKDGRPEVA